MIPKLV